MQSTPAEKSAGKCSRYVQVLWTFMVMILEELCQRKFTQEEEVEVSCNERRMQWCLEGKRGLIIEGKN